MISSIGFQDLSSADLRHFPAVGECHEFYSLSLSDRAGGGTTIHIDPAGLEVLRKALAVTEEIAEAAHA